MSHTLFRRPMSFALSLLYAFLMLLLPLAEALYNNRSPGALLYLYWVESFVLMCLHPLRIVLHQRWTNATGHYVKPLRDDRPNERRQAAKVTANASPFTYLTGFLPIVALFTMAHGIFVFLLVFVFKLTGPVNPADIRAATIWGAGVPLGLFLVDVLSLRHWPFTRLQGVVGGIVFRLITTQLGIIFGVLATAITKSPRALVGTFFVFRVLTDGVADWSRRSQRSGVLSDRFARMVAKKENKSIDKVRAEFLDSVKADRELESVLNAPFDPSVKRQKS